MLYIFVYLETITCCFYLYIWRLLHVVSICIVGEYNMLFLSVIFGGYNMLYISVYLETIIC